MPGTPVSLLLRKERRPVRGEGASALGRAARRLTRVRAKRVAWSRIAYTGDHLGKGPAGQGRPLALWPDTGYNRGDKTTQRPFNFLFL